MANYVSLQEGKIFRFTNSRNLQDFLREHPYHQDTDLENFTHIFVYVGGIPRASGGGGKLGDVERASLPP